MLNETDLEMETDTEVDHYCKTIKEVQEMLKLNTDEFLVKFVGQATTSERIKTFAVKLFFLPKGGPFFNVKQFEAIKDIRPEEMDEMSFNSKSAFYNIF